MASGRSGREESNEGRGAVLDGSGAEGLVAVVRIGEIWSRKGRWRGGSWPLARHGAQGPLGEFRLLIEKCVKNPTIVLVFSI